jgi:hypothetical protein
VKTQSRRNIPRVRPNALAILSAEKLSCFLSTRDDLRAAGGDGRATRNTTGRLAQFVLENEDLLAA